MKKGATHVMADVPSNRASRLHWSTPSTIVPVVLVLLTAAVLFSADQLLLLERQYQGDRHLSRLTPNLAMTLNQFFAVRLGAVKAARLVVEDSSPDLREESFVRIANALFGTVEGLSAVGLLDAKARPILLWPESADHRKEFEALEASPLQDTLAKAFALHKAVTSNAVKMPDGDSVIIVVEPCASSPGAAAVAVVGVFRIRCMLQRALNAELGEGYVAFLEDPAGQRVVNPQALPPKGRVQRALFKVFDGTWKLNLSMSVADSYALAVRRLTLSGLGLVLAISFFVTYFVFAHQSAELMARNAQLAAQAEGTQNFNARLIRLNKELDDFAYTVSHDLKEPLRGIEGLTKVFLAEYGTTLDGPGRECIQSIGDSGTRMRRLVDDLLRFSRNTRRKYPHEAVDFNELIQEMLRTLEYAISQRTAVVRVQPGLPRLTCDRVRMAELFQNLVSNALKFSNGSPPKIDIGYQALPAEHLFWVQDNGIGIRPEDHERIFEIFQRVNPSGNGEGSGVGLTICKRIVESHGGRIWVQSELNAGARFCFSLPKRPPAKTAG